MFYSVGQKGQADTDCEARLGPAQGVCAVTRYQILEDRMDDQEGVAGSVVHLHGGSLVLHCIRQHKVSTVVFVLLHLLSDSPRSGTFPGL